MAASTPTTGTWTIDPAHSMVEFVARHMMISKVKGRFTDLSGTIEVGSSEADHRVEVSIDVASVDTGDAKRDEHLRSDDFFSADDHKQMTFRSTGVQAKGDRWLLSGELTIRGTTRPVEVEFEYTGSGTNPYGVEVAGFEGRTRINRKDFGLEWNVALEAGGVLVGDMVDINLDIQAQHQEG
jgi:polyisoprenoid-binding protein YceI